MTVNKLVSEAPVRCFGIPNSLIGDRVRVCFRRLDDEPFQDLARILAMAQSGLTTSNKMKITMWKTAHALISVALHAPSHAIYARCRALLARFMVPVEREIEHAKCIIRALFKHKRTNFGYAYYEILRNMSDLYARGALEENYLLQLQQFRDKDPQERPAWLVAYAEQMSQKSDGQRMLLQNDYGRIAALIDWPQRIKEASQHELRALIERLVPGTMERNQRALAMTPQEICAAALASDKPVNEDREADITLQALASLFGGTSESSENGSTTESSDDKIARKKIKHTLPILGVWNRVATNTPIMEQAYDSLVSQQRTTQGLDICISHYLFAIVNEPNAVSTKSGANSSSKGVAIKLLTGPLRGLQVASFAQLVDAYGGLTAGEKKAWQSGKWRLSDNIDVVLPTGDAATKFNGWSPIATILKAPPFYLHGEQALQQMAIDADLLFIEEPPVVRFGDDAEDWCEQDDLPIGKTLTKKLEEKKQRVDSKCGSNGKALRRITPIAVNTLRFEQAYHEERGRSFL
jgi:hypothetical protein